MPARLAAAATALAVLALPAAAHAKHVADHATHGPSATPLIVELILAAVIVLVVVTRKPIARAVHARLARREPKPRTSPQTAGE
jgi:hypothetical protein